MPVGEIYSLDVVPNFFKTENNRERFVSCDDEKVKQTLEGATGPGSGFGDGQCIPDCFGKVCGDDGCGGVCGTCDVGFFCNASNVCESSCGNGVLDSGETCDGGVDCQQNCECPSGYIADGNLGCTTIGNGVCDLGETCSQEPVSCDGQQANCLTGQTCQNLVCDWQGGSYDEDEYCIDLGYSEGDCVSNKGQCTSEGGVNEEEQPGAEIYCHGKVLCCFLG